jgi:hypothetical protein
MKEPFPGDARRKSGPDECGPLRAGTRGIWSLSDSAGFRRFPGGLEKEVVRLSAGETAGQGKRQRDGIRAKRGWTPGKRPESRKWWAAAGRGFSPRCTGRSRPGRGNGGRSAPWGNRDSREHRGNDAGRSGPPVPALSGRLAKPHPGRISHSAYILSEELELRRKRACRHPLFAGWRWNAAPVPRWPVGSPASDRRPCPDGCWRRGMSPSTTRKPDVAVCGLWG